MIPPELEAEIDACCDKYEAVWQAGEVPNLHEFLGSASEAVRPHLLHELISLERHYRRDEAGQPLPLEQLVSLYPKLADEMDTLVASGEDSPAPDAAHSDVQLASDSDHYASHGLHVRCPHCSNPMEILADSPFEDVTCRTCGSTFNLVDREGTADADFTLRRLGRFDLISRLGVGGFGTVWKARDSELDRLVAIKIPRKGQLTAADIEQFYREARAAAQLSHRNIVSVYEVGRDADSVFIVSDFVRGQPLSDVLESQRLSAREIATIGVAIAEGLQHAHEQGIIHRDLKPSNIMIDEQGNPLIMDFGLAKRDVGEVTMTVDGQILGTPGYMSPEQARGESHWTDRRSDIYSLGTMLFRMTTGELPFRGDMQRQLQQKLVDDPPDPWRLAPKTPRDLATIIYKCIQRDPNHRYASARELKLELQRFLDGEPILARPLSTAARLYRWASRKPALATAIVLTCLLAILGPLAAWQQRTLVRQRDLRLAEREGLIANQKTQVDQQAAEIAKLEAELNALKGGDPGIATRFRGWRVSLARDLLEARQETMSSILQSEESGSLESVQAGLGLGLLHEQLGHPDEALDSFQRTQALLARLTEERGQATDLLDASADCWQRMAKQHQRLGDLPAARLALDKALEIRRQLTEEEASGPSPQLRLLESTLQKSAVTESQTDENLELLNQATPVIESMANHWPTSAEGFYRFVCQLTKNEVLLGEQE